MSANNIMVEPHAAQTGVFRPQSVSIVVPCFNEEAGIAPLSKRLSALCVALQPDYHGRLLFVDDGSTDGTVEQLRRAYPQLVTTSPDTPTAEAPTEDSLARDRTERPSGLPESQRILTAPDVRIVQHNRNRGIAAAILTGIQAAHTEIVCSIDSDCSYDPLQLIPMLAMLTESTDIVTASPYHPEGRVLNVPGWRLALSRSASAVYRFACDRPWHTFTSCFRVYRKSAMHDLSLRYEGFVGIAEMLWRLDRRGARIVECPARLDVRQYGQSKMRVAQVTWEHLRLLRHVLHERYVG